MFDPKQLDDLTDRLTKLLPKGVRDVQQDLQKNMRALLQGTFEKMNLVTREEFDIQASVLARTREKLEALEKTVVQMEKESSSSSGRKKGGTTPAEKA